VSPAPPVAHSHPEAAKLRNNSSSDMMLFCKSVGCEPYYIQLSAADIRNGKHGSRDYHWAKDLTVEPYTFQPGLNDILCIVDTDMYLDMPWLLATRPNTYLISTFCPTSVADVQSDYRFTFDDESCVKYVVNGGAIYEHKVWNYATDILVAKHPHFLGLWYSYTVYNIDRRQNGPHHQLLLLTPIASYTFPLYNFGSWLAGTELRRLNLVNVLSDGKEVKKFLRLVVASHSGTIQSTGRPLSYAVANISVKDDDTIATVARTTGTFTPASIKMVLSKSETEYTNVSQETASVLLEYHKFKQPWTSDIVYPMDQSFSRYQYNLSYYEPDARPSQVAYMSPIALGAYAPDKTLGNDLEAVEGRVNSIKEKPDATIPPMVLEYVMEYINLIIPDDLKETFHPLDLDEVFERQSRPDQRNILDQAASSVMLMTGQPRSTFQKDEAYAKVTSPRIITTDEKSHKLNYAGYCYSLYDWVESFRWYAFGKKPKEIADRVAHIALYAKHHISCSDFRRFDGHIGVVCRFLDRALMLRAFHPKYHEDIVNLQVGNVHCTSYTSYKVKFDTGLTQGSGIGDTAGANTLRNGGVSYTALRLEGYTPVQAFARLGSVAGDDGIHADINIKCLKRAAEMWHQEIDVEVYNRGDLGVNYLARLYGPDVWYGSPNSCCDIKRQLVKFHLTKPLYSNVTPMRKLSEKVLSLSYTDYNTPIIGEFVKMFMKRFKHHLPSKLGDKEVFGVASWTALLTQCSSASEQYPNVHDVWMDACVDRDLPNFNYVSFKQWINTFDEDTVFKPPCCYQPPEIVKKGVVVNGDTLANLPKAATPKVLSDSALKGMCKQFVTTGKCTFGDKCKYKHKKAEVKS